MSTNIKISPQAEALLQRRLAGQWVEVTDETLPLYLELVDAALMIPLHSFARGQNGAFWLTEAACELRESLNGQASHAPSV